VSCCTISSTPLCSRTYSRHTALRARGMQSVRDAPLRQQKTQPVARVALDMNLAQPARAHNGAIPRASALSVLLCIADSAARACQASPQIADKPRCFSSTLPRRQRSRSMADLAQLRGVGLLHLEDRIRIGRYLDFEDSL
jgi:hypothetical protein